MSSMFSINSELEHIDDILCLHNSVLPVLEGLRSQGC